MKWGVHRAQKFTSSVGTKVRKAQSKEKSYRDKLSKTLEVNKDSTSRRVKSDMKIMEYRNQSLGKRVAKSAANTVVENFVLNTVLSMDSMALGESIVNDRGKAFKMVSEAVISNVSKYGKMSPAQIAMEVASVGVATATDVAVKNTAAKQAIKNYSNSGKLKKDVNANARITKANAIYKSADIAKWMTQTVVPNLD